MPDLLDLDKPLIDHYRVASHDNLWYLVKSTMEAPPVKYNKASLVEIFDDISTEKQSDKDIVTFDDEMSKLKDKLMEEESFQDFVIRRHDAKDALKEENPDMFSVTQYLADAKLWLDDVGKVPHSWSLLKVKLVTLIKDDTEADFLVQKVL
ncbi:uncharacterized protein NDAI_0H02820 [Naumovozyma dairenensis CBS 421]|uniref:Uncharacterized protein n=1 Tax=Naumovozyma dairenensis (strain ATCC 10597 / BCRC 20456 / CBS 421 / NBRC 0211 / NRRL Y-12639) TaxID=1071378 RepID=G0WF95_NAUDC|nr:hypothetical protein NDAI_0H02820 [Naumovozyma dairenensis CBS 421]CCD26456.1 hypothetical protein NDAI_0H02820 [Naumovozyma dairenensis CBS 421]